MAIHANNLKQLSSRWVKTKQNKPLNRTQGSESSRVDSLHSLDSSEPLKLNKIVKKLAIVTVQQFSCDVSSEFRL